MVQIFINLYRVLKPRLYEKILRTRFMSADGCGPAFQCTMSCGAVQHRIVSIGDDVDGDLLYALQPNDGYIPANRGHIC